MTSRLGLFAAVEERVFSSASSKPSSPPPSESASPTLSSLAERLESNSDDGEGAASSSSSSSFHLRRRSRRRRSRALSGLVNVSSIISEDDIILPDSALVAKILSKNATVEKNLVAGLANLTRRGALKDMIVEEFRALRKTPQWALNSAGETINATKAAFAYPSTAKLQGANSALAQQQKETVARAVFRVLLPARDVSLAVRAAFHDAGVYNPNAVPPTSKGGANGSLRKELAWPSNAGIVAIWPFISMGHKILNAKFGNGSFSWADSIALAGAAGVEKAGKFFFSRDREKKNSTLRRRSLPTSTTTTTITTKNAQKITPGGPTITIGLGRPDAATADPKVGLATDPLAGINLTGDEAVAAWADAGQTPETLATLMGAHTMGRSALTPLEGPLGPPSFTNYFYKASLAQKCSFAVDNALATQPQTATFVEAYAADEVCSVLFLFLFSSFRPLFFADLS